MPRTRVPSEAEGRAGCCDLRDLCFGPPLEPPPHTYTDPFGYTYRLCALHYEALVRGLHKAERFRPTTTVPRRRTGGRRKRLQEPAQPR